MKMVTNKTVVALYLLLLIGLTGCSRQQSDWEKTRAANTTDSYEQFLKKYPNGEFTAQAQARVKELYEERDWQKARDTDTLEGYQAFLKQYPEGKWTEEARIRVENFSLAQAPSSTTPGAADSAASASATGNATPGDANSSALGSASPHAALPSPALAPSPLRSANAVPPNLPAGSANVQSGSYGVQLGAFKSSATAAHQRWVHLYKADPKPLAGLSPTVSPKKGASGTLYRLQVVGLTEKHARSICAGLKLKAQPCLLLPPAHP
jgi:SPOR domain